MRPTDITKAPEKESLNFIEEIIEEDLERQTRRPRAHAFSAGAQRLPAHRPRQGHRRQFRDWRKSTAARPTCASTIRTPTTEDTEYVENIKRDIRWLGYDWEDREYYASDYFRKLYECRDRADQKGLAYVDDSSAGGDRGA
jgi:glutaminyl-tRNA synthetase